MTEKGSDALFPPDDMERVKERLIKEEARLAEEEERVARNPTPDDPGKDYPAPDYSDAN